MEESLNKSDRRGEQLLEQRIGRPIKAPRVEDLQHLTLPEQLRTITREVLDDGSVRKKMVITCPPTRL